MWLAKRVKTAVGFVLLDMFNRLFLKDKGEFRGLTPREYEEIYEKQLIKFNKVISSIDEFKKDYLILMKLMKRSYSEQGRVRNNKMLKSTMKKYYALLYEKDKRLHKSLRNIEKEMARI